MNEGETRESLKILEKVGMMKGLLKSLGTEADVNTIWGINMDIDGNHWRPERPHSQTGLVRFYYIIIIISI